jgi:hypothetical protein
MIFFGSKGLAFTAALFYASSSTVDAILEPIAPVPVSIQQDLDGNFQLMREGKPFNVRGIGGHRHIDEFIAAGGNTLRTWGVDDLERIIDGKPLLDYAHAKGLTVLAGIWIQHERHGFDYSDPHQLEAQRQQVREAVIKYKDHPAILMWGLGNEMEAFRGDADATHIWQELEILAAMVKELDPHHPVLTAVAGVTVDKAKQVLRHCPSIDVLGVNAYAAAANTGKILNEAGWDRAFALTEFGPRGHWEVENTPWGAPIEPSADIKARYYIESYQKMISDAGDRCIGTFAFLWGQKQEVTHTWYSMFLPTGEKLPAVDAMTFAWSGEYPETRCPEIISVDFPAYLKEVSPGSKWVAKASAVDPQGQSLRYQWQVISEQTAVSTGGDKEPTPDRHPQSIIKSASEKVYIRAPQAPGAYRLFITVRNESNAATTANFPFKVSDLKLPSGE